MCLPTWWGKHMCEGQRITFWNLLPLSTTQVLKITSGYQDWGQIPLHTEPSCQPLDNSVN